MLVLTRKIRQRILIGKDIVIEVIEIGNREVRIGIDAPKDMPILREEVRRRTERNVIIENDPTKEM